MVDREVHPNNGAGRTAGEKITFTAHCEGEVRELGLYLLVSTHRWDLKVHGTKNVVV